MAAGFVDLNLCKNGGGGNHRRHVLRDLMGQLAHTKMTWRTLSTSKTKVFSAQVSREYERKKTWNLPITVTYFKVCLNTNLAST